MNIAIVDDETDICEQIKAITEKTASELCCDIYTTGEGLLKSDKIYDLIFLDIQMEGINGIKAAVEIRRRSRNTVLIFVSAIKEYVFEAFDVAAFHYLLKPIEEDKLTEVFIRAVEEAERLNSIKNEKLFIKTGRRNITLNQEDILYMENRGKKVEIHTLKEVIEIYAAMNRLERDLSDSFYRCHRGYLVNMAYIAEYGSDSIRLSSGDVIFIARDKYNGFVKKYMSYLKKGGAVRV